MNTSVSGATANLPRGAALVTGAARGMGYACALALGRQGFPVVANDFNAAQLAAKHGERFALSAAVRDCIARHAP